MKHNSDRKNGKNRAENCCIGKEGSENPKSRFYQQSWFILLSLFFFAPVGIFLLYRFGKWNKFLKAAAALLSLVWFLFVVFAEYPLPPQKPSLPIPIPNISKTKPRKMCRSIPCQKVTHHLKKGPKRMLPKHHTAAKSRGRRHRKPKTAPKLCRPPRNPHRLRHSPPP